MKSIIKVIGNSLNFISLFSPRFAAKKAFDLFCTPQKGKVADNQKAFLTAAQHEKLNHSKTPIQVYKWDGKGKTVLLIHGWESNSARWKPFIKRLQKENYNIIALDAPAHGNSGSKTFNAVLYSEFLRVVIQKYNPEILIGHSVGGMSSVFYQHKHNNPNIEKMVLLGAASEFENIFNQFKTLLSFNKRVTKRLNKILYNRFGIYPHEFSTAKFIKTIKAPILMIHDTEDRIIPYSDAQLIKKNAPHAKFISTTGLGHSLKSKQVYDAVIEFLEGYTNPVGTPCIAI